MDCKEITFIAAIIAAIIATTFGIPETIDDVKDAKDVVEDGKECEECEKCEEELVNNDYMMNWNSTDAIKHAFKFSTTYASKYHKHLYLAGKLYIGLVLCPVDWCCDISNLFEGESDMIRREKCETEMHPKYFPEKTISKIFLEIFYNCIYSTDEKIFYKTILYPQRPPKWIFYPVKNAINEYIKYMTTILIINIRNSNALGPKEFCKQQKNPINPKQDNTSNPQ